MNLPIVTILPARNCPVCDHEWRAWCVRGEDAITKFDVLIVTVEYPKYFSARCLNCRRSMLYSQASNPLDPIIQRMREEWQVEAGYVPLRSINIASCPSLFNQTTDGWEMPHIPSPAEIMTKEMIKTLPADHEILEVVRGASSYYYATHQGLPRYWWEGFSWVLLA